MHVLILSKRNGQAQARLLRSAELLAQDFELDPALVAGLKATSKDPAVRALQEREGVADLLDALAIRLGLLTPALAGGAREEAAPEEEPVTAVTEGEEMEPAGEPQVDPELPGDELPPPVLDEEPRSTAPEAVEQPSTEELPVEEPVEEEPEEKAARRSARKPKKK